jgi:hypothetical protein
VRNSEGQVGYLYYQQSALRIKIVHDVQEPQTDPSLKKTSPQKKDEKFIGKIIPQRRKRAKIQGLFNEKKKPWVQKTPGS